MSRDWLTLLGLYAYALAAVGLTEIAARRWAWAAEWGRKAIHLAVGVLPFGIVLGMSDRQLAVLAPASFVVLNWLSHRFRLSRAMDAVSRPSLGTVYYPLSLLILIVWLWDTPARPLATLAMLPMIIGDAAAAIAGTLSRGTGPSLALPPHGRKTLIGSGAMLLGSWLSLWAGLALVGSAAGLKLAPGGTGLAATALAVACFATAAELVSPAGTDNLTVPLISGSLLYWLAFGYGSAAALLLGLGAAAIVALTAWRLSALSGSGAAAAVLTGGLVFAVGGWLWAGALLAFFISSSRLSRLAARIPPVTSSHDAASTLPGGRTAIPSTASATAGFAHARFATEGYAAKGSRRDWHQVLANGGVPILAAVLAAADAGPWTTPLLLGSLAAATADTWATELGSLSSRLPRLITTGQPVAPGTSGGITLVGTLASMGGALLIAAAGAAAGQSPWFWGALLGGIAGSVCDSLLGATIQSVRWCRACDVETERLTHHCGQPTEHRRGLSWLNNDGVNALAATIGGLVAVAVSLAL